MQESAFEFSESRDLLVAQEFRERYRKDLEQGLSRTLADYVAQWPEHEALIAREHAEIRLLSTVVASGPSLSQPPDLDQIGPYVIEETLGRGGQGVVYRARDTRLNRTVALKVLTGYGLFAAPLMRRFRREAEVTSKLDHPGICAVYDAGVEEGVPYIAMRLVEGRNLASHIAGARGAELSAASTWRDDLASADEAARSEPHSDESRPVTSMTREELTTLLTLFERAARALHAAHEAGVVHRDIKPGNIMVDPEGEPVILDFGLARDESDEEAATLTRTGDLFGTPAYMSPEQVSGEMLQLDRRTDVWSLGATLYECLTAGRPFKAPTREGLFQAILTHEPADPRQRNRAISRDLKVVLDAALEKDRDRRYATAEAFAEDLAAIRDHHPIAARPIGTPGRILRWSRRHPAKAALIAALLIGMPLITYLGGIIVANRPKIEAQERAALAERVEQLVSRGYYELYHVSPENALASFTEARQLLPGSGEAIGGEVLALIALDRADEALVSLGSTPEEHPELRRVEVDLLRALGRDAEATRLAATCPENPSTPFGLFLRAHASITKAHETDLKSARAQKELRRALTDFERAIAYSPSPRLVHYIGFTHAVSHLPEEVHTQPLVEGLTENWPKSAAAWIYAGYVARAKEDRERELACFLQAERLDPTFTAHGERAVTLTLMGRHAEALSLAREAVRRQPGSTEARGTLAIALNNLERYDEALSLARELRSRSPSDKTAHIVLTHALRRTGRIAQALEVSKRGITLQPKSPAMLYQRGMTLSVAGKNSAALEIWRRLLATGTVIGGMYINIGHTFFVLERYEEAVSMLERAVEGRRAGKDVWDQLGEAYLRLGRLDEAERAKRTSLRWGPPNISTFVQLAWMRSRRGDHEGAIEELQRALAIDPDHPDALAAMGRRLMSLDEFERALGFLSRAIKADPNRLRSHLNLGNALTKLGRHDEALQHYLRGARLDSPVKKSDASVLRGLADGLRRAGHTDLAAACYRKAIAGDPTLAEAYCNLAAMEINRGSLDEAIALYRQGHIEGSKRKDWSYDSKSWLLDVLTRRFREVRLDDRRRAGELAAEILQHRPDDGPALVALALWRADPETPVTDRDVADAVTLAVRATRLSQRKDAAALHALAFALFHNGLGPAALTVQEEALALMRGRDRRHITLDEVEDQLERFRSSDDARKR